MKLEDAVSQFDNALFGEVADTTRTWYAYMLRPLVDQFGERLVRDITATDLREWRQEVFGERELWAGSDRPTEEREPAPATKRGYIRALRVFFNWLVSEGKLIENPAARLRLPPQPDRPPRAIAPADFDALLKAATMSRDKAIILFLADTGCRVSGLCGLKTYNLHLDDCRAEVWEKGKGGNGVSRWVMFGRVTYLALIKWLTERPSDGEHQDHVFLSLGSNTAGRPLTRDGVYQMLKRLAGRAGVTGRFNPHSFRHAAARNWLENGADISIVKELLGHSSISITSDFYARWTADELADWHARYTPFNGAEKQPLDKLSIGHEAENAQD